jgi:phosphate starvation-inducible PhoH-like protein
LIVVNGPAGTGKTFISCKWGLQQLFGGGVNKIVITRPLVSVCDEYIGFIPGEIVNKMEPWMRPIYDSFLEEGNINKKMLNEYIHNNSIETIPLGFMRGCTFKNAFIFADEMQNSSPLQMKMLLTRIGNNSKVVISGDLQQTDIDFNNNGLYDILNKLKNYNNNMIKIITLNNEDVLRSEFTSVILDIYK